VSRASSSASSLPVELLLVLVVVALAVLVISAPLRPGRVARRDAAGSAERADLEAARDAKYAEIRDAEMDYRMGKLSEADWRALDRQLRRQAVDLLHRLDLVGEPPNRED
jgi:hypothetical protein